MISRHYIYPPKMKIYKCEFQICTFVTGSRMAFERHMLTTFSHRNISQDEDGEIDSKHNSDVTGFREALSSEI